MDKNLLISIVVGFIILISLSLIITIVAICINKSIVLGNVTTSIDMINKIIKLPIKYKLAKLLHVIQNNNSYEKEYFCWRLKYESLYGDSKFLLGVLTKINIFCSAKFKIKLISKKSLKSFEQYFSKKRIVVNGKPETVYKICSNKKLSKYLKNSVTEIYDDCMKINNELTDIFNNELVQRSFILELREAYLPIEKEMNKLKLKNGLYSNIEVSKICQRVCDTFKKYSIDIKKGDFKESWKELQRIAKYLKTLSQSLDFLPIVEERVLITYPSIIKEIEENIQGNLIRNKTYIDYIEVMRNDIQKIKNYMYNTNFDKLKNEIINLDDRFKKYELYIRIERYNKNIINKVESELNLCIEKLEIYSISIGGKINKKNNFKAKTPHEYYQFENSKNKLAKQKSEIQNLLSDFEYSSNQKSMSYSEKKDLIINSISNLIIILDEFSSIGRYIDSNKIFMDSIETRLSTIEAILSNILVKINQNKNIPSLIKFKNETNLLKVNVVNYINELNKNYDENEEKKINIEQQTDLINQKILLFEEEAIKLNTSISDIIMLNKMAQEIISYCMRYYGKLSEDFFATLNDDYKTEKYLACIEHALLKLSNLKTESYNGNNENEKHSS